MNYIATDNALDLNHRITRATGRRAEAKPRRSSGTRRLVFDQIVTLSLFEPAPQPIEHAACIEEDPERWDGLS